MYTIMMHMKDAYWYCDTCESETLWFPWSFSSKLLSVPFGNLLSSSIRSSTPSFWGEKGGERERERGGGGEKEK